LEENKNRQRIIAIDEIQKLPTLLDEVHRLISKFDMKFILTGSSARKLKRGSANLLAGRAWRADLFALTSNEIPKFNLLTYLNCGGLPHIYGKKYAAEELNSYVSTYLREEIQSEALTRNLESFSEFLDAIAMSNGEEINFESLASDCGVSPGTLKNYIGILEDTLIGFTLSSYTKTKKRKAISRGKHYLFDLGVVNVLFISTGDIMHMRDHDIPRVPIDEEPGDLRMGKHLCNGRRGMEMPVPDISRFEALQLCQDGAGRLRFSGGAVKHHHRGKPAVYHRAKCCKS